jgi:hypothetical protein
MICSFCKEFAYTSKIDLKGVKWYLCEQHFQNINLQRNEVAYDGLLFPVSAEL